jgi:hypothetical protein
MSFGDWTPIASTVGNVSFVPPADGFILGLVAVRAASGQFASCFIQFPPLSGEDYAGANAYLEGERNSILIPCRG